MTAERTTPAIGRAVAMTASRPLHESWPETVQVVLTTALTDPDDGDFLARTLWLLDRQALGLIPVSPAMFDQSPSRKHWRAVADGLRMMLTGSGS